MKKNPNTSEILVDTLIRWGVDVIFGLPGDGINPIIEALRLRKDEIKFVLVRHEETASLMASGYAKYTGKLGVCLATAGPGAIHLLNGLYDAKSDGSPVLAITGRTASDMIGSGYQQDLNILQLFSDVAEHNNMINTPEQARSAVDTAIRRALSRRQVSHLTIPIDVQSHILQGAYTAHNIPGHTSEIPVMQKSLPPLTEIQAAADVLNEGKKIVILVGQGALGAQAEVLALAEKLQAPVVKALLGKAVIPDDGPYALGGLGLLGTLPSSKAMSEADTLLMIGTSFPYSEFLPKPGDVRAVQIDLFAEKIGQRYPVEVGLVGDAKLTMEELLPRLEEHKDAKFLTHLQNAMKEWRGALEEQTKHAHEKLKASTVVAEISRNLADNAIVSVDTGTSTVWGARYIDVREGMKFAVSGNLATMACSLSYAMAGQVAFPDRQSVALTGDGAFQMLMADFATAVMYKLPVKVFVLKNDSLNFILWEQIVALGNPEYAIELSPIDFVAFAKACGGKGYRLETPDDLRSIKRILKEDGPVLVEVVVDPFDAPLPPHIEFAQAKNFLSAMVRGQSNRWKIMQRAIEGQAYEELRKLGVSGKKSEK